MATPVLHVLVGPNGAGKSTLYTRVLGPRTHLPFVNADVMFAESPERFADEHEAGLAAAEERAERIARSQSFITETVFSHPSKLDALREARAGGYRIHLHAVAIPVDLTVRRVAERTMRGGHDVDEDKIRSRYERLLEQRRRSARSRRRTDGVRQQLGSAAARRPIAYFRDGRRVGDVTWPAWTPAPLLEL
ncbi:MAG: AAA family ATPase [Microthrixaceae bacterium]